MTDKQTTDEQATEHALGKPSIGELSIDAALLYRRIAEMQIGSVLTYEALSEVIGRSVCNGGRGALATARRKAQRENGIVTDCVKGVGIKRLDSVGIIGTGKATVKKIHRAAGRGARKLTCVQDLDALSRDQRTDLLTQQSMLGALGAMTDARRVAKVEKAINDKNDKLALAQTLELFAK